MAGTPPGSTNADMQDNFSKAIAMCQGTPFLFAFLHNDLSQLALNKAHSSKQALLQFDTLDGELAAVCAQACKHVSL